MHIQNCYHSRAPCCHSCSPSIISFPLFPCLSYPSLFRPSCIFLIHHLRLFLLRLSRTFLLRYLRSFLHYFHLIYHFRLFPSLSRTFLLCHLRFFLLCLSRTFLLCHLRFFRLISSFLLRHSRASYSSFPRRREPRK